VPTKKGNKLHSEGNMLPFSEGAPCTQSVYSAALAAALRAEVEHRGIGAKAIMKWTGASERAVKGWLSGERGPSGEHLISLMINSSAVTAAVMRLAKQGHGSHSEHVADARRYILDALLALDRVAP
jgi:hypothetical protein